jgi:hypothetical protein
MQRTPASRKSGSNAPYRPTHLRPRGTGGGKGASRPGSLSVTTTDALFAGKVQRKVSNGIAGLAAAGSSRHRQKIAAIPASASILPRSWHRARAAPPTVAARTRIVSAAGIRLITGNLCDLSKGYFATTFLSSSPPTPARQSGLCWCCRFCRRRIIFGPTCARGRGMLAAGPELRITGAAAQTRMVCVARIWLVSRKSTRFFKGIICDDISEFESHMPSQAVQSPPAKM